MNWQLLIVYVIIGISICWIVWRVVRMVKRTKEGKSPCDSCTSECALKEVKRRKAEGGKRES